MSVLFETEKLRVRTFRPEDAKDALAWLGDGEVMRYVEEPFDLEKTEAFLAAHGLTGKPHVYAVEEKESGRLTGHLIFHPYDEDSYELGWILAKDFWNKGYASMLTEAAIAFAGKQGIPYLVIECGRRQNASIALARKYGFTADGSEDGLLRFRRTVKEDI